MDGVVADFDTGFKDVVGKSWSDASDENRWDVLLDCWPHQNGQGFYYDLPEFEGAVEFYERVKELGVTYNYKVEFLTGVPKNANMPTAFVEKRLWVDETFNDDIAVVHIGPWSEHKQLWSRPGDVLIDDRKRNVDQWIAKGGIGIVHDSSVGYEQTLKQLEAALKTMAKPDAEDNQWVTIPFTSKHVTVEAIATYEVERLLRDTSNRSSLTEFVSMSASDLIKHHHSYGRYIRNVYQLWHPEHPYTKTGEIIINGVDETPNHPDNYSMQIIERVWEMLKDKDIC